MYATDGRGGPEGGGSAGGAGEEQGRRAGALALGWMLAKPGITAPIVGATKQNHLEDAVAALAIKLTAEETAALEEAYIPHPVLGFS